MQALSGKVAALAGVPVDESRLAPVQIGVPHEALEVGVLVVDVLVQAVRTPGAEGGHGVLGGGGARSGGGLRGKAYESRDETDITTEYTSGIARSLCYEGFKKPCGRGAVTI